VGGRARHRQAGKEDARGEIGGGTVMLGVDALSVSLRCSRDFGSKEKKKNKIRCSRDFGSKEKKKNKIHRSS
jgi:hypothetical protein